MKNETTEDGGWVAVIEHLLAGALMYLAGVEVFGWGSELVSMGVILIGIIKVQPPNQCSNGRAGLVVLMVCGMLLAAEFHQRGWTAWMHR